MARFLYVDAVSKLKVDIERRGGMVPGDSIVFDYRITANISPDEAKSIHARIVSEASECVGLSYLPVAREFKMSGAGGGPTTLYFEFMRDVGYTPESLTVDPNGGWPARESLREPFE